VCRKSAHKRNNSDGTLQLTASSLHDLTSLDSSASTAAAAAGSQSAPRRRSVFVTTGGTDIAALSTNDNKPEVQ